MKKFFMLCLVSLAAMSVSAQNMTVVLTNGESETFTMADVKSVSFQTVAALNNQYQRGAEVGNVGSVLELQNAAGYSYQIYKESGVSAPSANVVPQFSLWLASELIGQDVDLAAAGDKARVTLDGKVAGKFSGTVKVTKKMGNLTLSLEAMADGNLLRAEYRGSYYSGYESSNTYSFVASNGEQNRGDATQLFRYNEPTGGAYHFAWGSQTVTNPEEYLSGAYAVRFRMAAALYNQEEVSLKDNASNYELMIYDYQSSKTYYANEYTVGTLTTKAFGNNLYLHLNATLTNGMTVDFDYFGATTTTTEEQLNAMIPAERETSNVQVFASDGKTTTWDKPILYAKMKEYKGMEKFYFVLDESSSLSDQMLTPLLSLNPSIYNQGEMDLTKMEANTWNIDFAGVQLYSPDNAYMPVPDNGTLTAKYDASTGEYEIKLTVQNYYPSSWGDGVSGSGEIVKLYYKGVPQAY